jgi:hypothetical protein
LPISCRNNAPIANSTAAHMSSALPGSDLRRRSRRRPGCPLRAVSGWRRGPLPVSNSIVPQLGKWPRHEAGADALAATCRNSRLSRKSYVAVSVISVCSHSASEHDRFTQRCQPGVHFARCIGRGFALDRVS